MVAFSLEGVVGACVCGCRVGCRAVVLYLRPAVENIVYTRALVFP